nr:beta-defensin 112 [Loxodonta africana]
MRYWIMMNVLGSLYLETFFSHTFGVFFFFFFTVGSDQPVSNPVPLFTTMCIWKFEKLSSKTHNSSTVFDKGRYETEERNTGKIKQVELYLSYFNQYLPTEMKFPKYVLLHLLLFTYITSSYFFLLPDRSKEHHAVFNMWDACIKLSGQCKRHCGEDQYRIAYCARHTVDCCMKRCKPVEK